MMPGADYGRAPLMVRSCGGTVAQLPANRRSGYSPRMTAPTPPRWPEHLDAVIAAPEHHRVLLDNPSVRVLETRIAPGQTVRLHTHRWPAVHYFLARGEIVRRDEAGNIEFDSRVNRQAGAAPEAVWSPPLGPHTLENVGRTPIHVITTEIKDSQSR